MIGPTGVGKTEIARRLAKMCGAPFIKVEATKYTEVGYVGRDVESMVRDLMAVGYNMVREEMQEKMKAAAEQRVEEDLLDLLLPGSGKSTRILRTKTANRKTVPLCCPLPCSELPFPKFRTPQARRIKAALPRNFRRIIPRKLPQQPGRAKARDSPHPPPAMKALNMPKKKPCLLRAKNSAACCAKKLEEREVEVSVKKRQKCRRWKSSPAAIWKIWKAPCKVFLPCSAATAQKTDGKHCRSAPNSARRPFGPHDRSG